MMLKIVKVVMWVCALIIALMVGLYFYYLYVPKPSLPSLPGDYQRHSLDPIGLNRSYGIYVPDNINEKPPLVFVLHGSGSSGEQIREGTALAFDVLAEEKGFILVYPEGYQNHWNDCRGSADYAANIENIDDVAFFKKMITHFESLYDVDIAQVFVTGHSNGGHMAYKLALEAPDYFSAFAPVSANMPVAENLDCTPSGHAVSIAIFNGTEDPLNPYNGGLVSIFGNDSRGYVHSSEDSINYWVALAEANDSAHTIEHPEYDGDQRTRIVETRWSGEKREDIRLYSMVGSGHVMPSKTLKAPRIMGRAASDIDGPREIVAFFLDKPKAKD